MHLYLQGFLAEGRVSQKTQGRVSRMTHAWSQGQTCETTRGLTVSHIDQNIMEGKAYMTQGRVSQKSKPHRGQGVVSHVPHRMQNLGEGRVSLKAQVSHIVSQKGRASRRTGSRPLDKGRVSQKARYHQINKVIYIVSRKEGSHKKQGLTDEGFHL